jgi:antitoxin ParD1/3/4
LAGFADPCQDPIMSDETHPPSLGISLPQSQREFVDAEVAARGYASASDYFSELITAEQKRRAQERLEELLIEGVNSGPGDEATPEFWERLRARANQRVEQRRKP